MRRDRPLSVWKESDSISGKKVNALVMILDGPGCSWSRKIGCTMCGYCNDVSDDPVTDMDLISQAEKAMEKYQGEPYIKIFTSGSFLDPEEIHPQVQKSITEIIGERSPGVRLLLESRPEYVSTGSVLPLMENVGKLEIAIGLETSSDEVRMRYIRKGFKMDRYIEAGKDITENGGLLKTYLLQKPPLMGENKAMDDVLDSIRDIHEIFPGSRISINPMNIQSRTVVERLFLKGMYRPPWLWSLVNILEKGLLICDGETHLMSSPTGGGKRRGVHNCGKCDMSILSAISDFSIRNEPDILPEPEYCCSNEWKRVLSTGELVPIPISGLS